MNELLLELAKQVPALTILLALCIIFFRFTTVIYENHKRDMDTLTERLIKAEKEYSDEKKRSEERLSSILQKATEALTRVSDRLKISG